MVTGPSEGQMVQCSNVPNLFGSLSSPKIWTGTDFVLDMDWDRTWGLGQVRDSWSNVPSLLGSLSSPKMWTGTDFVLPWGTGAD